MVQIGQVEIVQNILKTETEILIPKLMVYLPWLYTFADPTLIFSDTITKTIKIPYTYLNTLNGNEFPLTLCPDKSPIQ